MKKSDTRTALLDCAQDLIQRVGANAMSYSDLSRKIGIRKASIHYHFPRKEDLIVAILSRCRDTYAEGYNRIVNSGNDASRKLYMISEIFEENAKKGKTCAVGMLSVEYESLGERVQEATQISIESSVRIYEKIFKQAVEEGTLSEEYDTYDLAYGYFCYLLGAQITARCTNDIDGFRRSSSIYIDRLLA